MSEATTENLNKPLASNPMPALVAGNAKLAENLDALARAVEPNPGGKLTITDYVHLATNNRVQVAALGKDLEKLVKAVTGGPLNVKLALEMAEGRVSQGEEDMARDEAAVDGELLQRLTAVLTGIETRNFSFLDAAGTPEFLRSCPTCASARALVEELNLAKIAADELGRVNEGLAKKRGPGRPKKEMAS